MFTQDDLKQIENRGISLEDIKIQIENFEKGFPYIDLINPATKDNGLVVFTDDEIQRLHALYADTIQEHEVLKFVPASGAASRMFQNLFSFSENYQGTVENIEAFNNDKGFNSVYRFINDIEKFAFYPELKDAMHRDGLDIAQCIADNNYSTIIDYLLYEKGLNYGNLPKGLLKFHKTLSGSRTPVEEHFNEGLHYARTGKKDKNCLPRNK